MKKLSKIFLAIAMVLVLAVPFVLAGCEIGGSNTKTEGIKIHTTFKTEYEVGEALDLTNGKITYTDAEGKETIVAITSTMVTSFSTATVGTRQMVVTYQGKQILIDYEVYKVVDVQVGDLFYCGSVLNPNPGIYDYVKFISSSQIDVKTSNATVANLPNDFFNDPYSAVRTVSNRHAVYTINNPFGSNGSIVITVVDENTISLTATNNTTNETRSGRLTKYVG